MDFYKNDVPKEICELKKAVGAAVCEEIERIASLKHEKILQNLNEVSKVNNKREQLLDRIIENSIINEDENYGIDYWARFIKQKN